jgi:hypothetical protein
MGTEVVFPAVKRTGLDVDNSPQSSAEVKNEWNYALCMSSQRVQGKLYLFISKV